jgi:hypothetical protein
MTTQNQSISLEPSTNTHTLEASSAQCTQISSLCKKLDVPQGGVVTHGEHGSVKIDQPTTLMFRQQEYNPVSQAIQNAYD